MSVRGLFQSRVFYFVRRTLLSLSLTTTSTSRQSYRYHNHEREFRTRSLLLRHSFKFSLDLELYDVQRAMYEEPHCSCHFTCHMALGGSGIDDTDPSRYLCRECSVYCSPESSCSTILSGIELTRSEVSCEQEHDGGSQVEERMDDLSSVLIQDFDEAHDEAGKDHELGGLEMLMQDCFVLMDGEVSIVPQIDQTLTLEEWMDEYVSFLSSEKENDA
ncbi:hypothetical protein CPB84DRAFT_1792943, partial [Gymnopilus junonius]